MKITYSDECRALLTRLEILPRYIEETCQAPTSMMLTQSKPPQYYAVKFFSPHQSIFSEKRTDPAKPHAQAVGRSVGPNHKIIYVHGILRKGAGGPVGGHEVEVHSVLELKDRLPAGSVTPKTPMREIFNKVVESFGVPVSCHPDLPAAKLFTGRWDGRMVHCNLERDQYYQVSGDFHVKEGFAQDVWVFSFKLYRDWFVNDS